jgi:hypothetical protein
MPRYVPNDSPRLRADHRIIQFVSVGAADCDSRPRPYLFSFRQSQSRARRVCLSPARAPMQWLRRLKLGCMMILLRQFWEHFMGSHNENFKSSYRCILTKDS